MSIDLKTLVDPISRILQNAGTEIMKIYLDPESSGQIEYKSDNSPLTIADENSNRLIVEELSTGFEFPILTEEAKLVDYEERKSWKKFWLVDPLDGTKEFINKNGEFTVNIALIENGFPVFGAIGVPARDVCYIGFGNTSMKLTEGKSEILKVNNRGSNRIAVRSKSHASPEEETVFQKYDASGYVSVGSSLKFCMIAEGKADIYYRHGPTMEWDIAAGHAIVRAAGGEVYSGNDSGFVFKYNKENLLNGPFLCLGFKI